MATKYLECKYCGTFWEYETSGGRLTGGMSGFIESTIMSHINMCKYWTPEQRLNFINRNEKRLKKKPNLHTIVLFDRKHTGVAQAPAPKLVLASRRGKLLVDK